VSISKPLYILLLRLLLPTASIAQTNKNTWGFYAGPQISTSIEKGTSGAGYVIGERKGYKIGFFNNYHFTTNFVVRSSIFYNQEGFERSQTFMPQFSLHYINLNLSAIEMLPIWNGAFYGGVGLFTGYCIAGNKLLDNNKQSIKEVEDFRPFDIGFTLQTGYQFNKGLFIGGGLRQAFNTYYTPASGSYKNVSYSLELGYILNYKRKPNKR
jgi:hypothetical protein